MNSYTMITDYARTSRAARVKEHVRPHLEALCRYLLPRGHCEGVEWRAGSTDGEPGRSLSVCLDGPKAGRWNDFGEYNDHGDIIDLWKRVRKTDFPDTLDEMETWLAGIPPTVASGPEWRHAAQPTRQYLPQQMPMEVERLWRSGVCRLAAETWMQFAIDGWRGWPRGTTARVCERQLMGLIKEPGSQRLLHAFIVEHPTGAGLVRAGYHAREIAPAPGQKPRWTFRPNARRDGCFIENVPFVLGTEELCRAELIVVLEGQWDAIAWAAAAGWLDHWPRGATVFGLRGATAWKCFLEVWKPFVPSRRRFLLVPDGDSAGQQWRKDFADQLLAAGHCVGIFSPPAGMDFSDLHRLQPFTQDRIGQIIQMSFSKREGTNYKWGGLGSESADASTQ